MNDGRTGLTRRATLHGLAVSAAAEKLTDGGFAEVSYADRAVWERPVLPPGAGNSSAFHRKCVACGLCIAVCPEKIIRPSSSLGTLGQPELDFRHGYCLKGCVKCTTVCPAGALAVLQAETKADVHVGEAVWKKDICLRTTKGENCTACLRKCPVRAISIVGGFPVIDRNACIGCGACEHVCPTRPKTAISVKGFEMQRTVRPVSEADLLAEMRTLLEDGMSLVVARDGVIVSRVDGRGIGPILSQYDAGNLEGAVVCDKVIGRAAAAICVLGAVRKVVSSLMSEDAVAMLKAHGVACESDIVVPRIKNRDRTGFCPMELATEKLTDPAEMLVAIREKLATLSNTKSGA